jgi:hypothetical protein
MIDIAEIELGAFIGACVCHFFSPELPAPPLMGSEQISGSHQQ